MRQAGSGLLMEIHCQREPFATLIKIILESSITSPTTTTPARLGLWYKDMHVDQHDIKRHRESEQS